MNLGWSHRQKHDDNQLSLFGAPGSVRAPTVGPRLSPEAAAIVHGHLPPPNVDQYLLPAEQTVSDASAQPEEEAAAPTTIVLPWDFRQTFPSPLEEAVGAGVLSEDDCDEEAIRSIHEEHAAECLTLLADLDAVSAAQRTGIDPRTGKKPRTEQSRQRLERYLATAPANLSAKFEEMMSVYENAFGESAATAFRSALHAWHRGVVVVAEGEPAQSPGGSQDPPSLAQRDRVTDDGLDPVGGPSLPRPAPLDDAVQRGVFGCDEDGEPVRPSPQEVAEITATHADRLMDLLDALQTAEAMLRDVPNTDRTARLHAKDRALSAYQSALALYGEDFGETAARHLDAWVQHQLDAQQPGRQYDPGHPWHYLRRGDACTPVPVEEIQPAQHGSFESRMKLPRDPAKRLAKLRTMLKDQSDQLQADRNRYEQIVREGPAALSEFDRKIAHAGDEELAWASAVALKYNHISNGMARVAWLEKQVGRHGEMQIGAG